MIKYPILFDVYAKSASGIQSVWESNSSAIENRTVIMAVPPEFEGPGGGFSPEDLYAMALQNCFIATFKVFAEKSRLKFAQINVWTKLRVDRNEKGIPWMAEANFKIRITGTEQKENAKRILEKTSQSCMILNSVNTVKSFEFEIE